MQEDPRFLVGSAEVTRAAIELRPSSRLIRLLEEHPLQLRSKVSEGTRTVAELVLDQRAQLTEGHVILANQKERVVAEAALAARLARDPSSTDTLGLKSDLARGIGNGQAAAKRGAAAFVAHLRDRLEQLPVICRIVAWLSRVTCREDARSAVQGVDRQARVIREYPLPDRLRQFAGLLAGVAGEAVRVLDHLGSRRIILEGVDLDSVERLTIRPSRPDQLGHFATFLAVARAQDEDHRAGGEFGVVHIRSARVEWMAPVPH